MVIDGDQQRQSRDLVDQSKLLRRRAKQANARSIERTNRTHHIWHQVTVGRVCEVCLLTQAKDEFEDESACLGAKAS